MLCTTEKIETLVERNVAFVAGDHVERADDLVDVLIDELLGTELRLAVQSAVAHAVDIAVHALVEGVQDTGAVARGLHLPEALETPADRFVIEILGFVRLLPLVDTTGLVVSFGGLAPLLVARGHVHRGLQALGC